MSTIVEQVKEGLTAKVEGIERALPYVKDAREIERLHKDLSGARAALAKLDEADTRSPEEIEKIASMINSEVEVESTETPWSELSPIEKFQYHVNLYSDTLEKADDQAKKQHLNLQQVLKHMVKTKGDAAFFMNPIIAQFTGSLGELTFSLETIGEQFAIKDKVMELIQDEDFYEKLELLNRYLNNPMNLPSLTEERENRIKELRNGQS